MPETLAPHVTPQVDVVIAVHDERRPIERAVASVLQGAVRRVRVTVVAHGLGVEAVRSRLGGLADDERVRVVPFVDGVRSPAGPFNHGLDLATAPFTSVMGSDDVLEPGAVDAWLALAERESADVVLARVRHEDGRPVRTPPTRLGRTRGLDGVRDRLAYRSAPLGLVSRAKFGALRFTTGVAVGEDIEYVNSMWFSGARLVLARGPAYVVMADVSGRVTGAARPVSDEFSFLQDALSGLRKRDEAVLNAYGTKFLRVQVFGAVHNRPDPDRWSSGEREELASVCRTVLALAPRAAAPLARADRSLLDAVLDPSVPVEALLDRSVARRRFGRPATLVPRDLRRVLHREAPLRFMVASVAAGR
ncbi:glycosyltransferase [Oerskovia turbata]|uniref:Glycosyltransferase n=1 Tax=Oerskovia turbata TaxID=1713 RepID=A0A4Q1KY54_9CELL|nr:glycosyltransferase [Oerskovia turbata]RXR26726.1 glycosyltransferase [Oerskovia turbata]RXR34459.1 glycosyltransferase [Oerskovia turbata]TGJ97738.1 glycosyl transferase family 2 [Actinotalea fermentans ATCC 43279 = JCM 9966 = DSM 3133]